jgi:hypothetical protein
MGAWGMDPWDNDTAADWFGDLWDGTSMVDRVLAVLRADGDEATVAALWFCSELCRVYVWPIDRYDETLDAAIAAADRILAGEDEEGLVEMWEDDPAFVAQIEGFRATLAARKSAGAGGDDA